VKEGDMATTQSKLRLSGETALRCEDFLGIDALLSEKELRAREDIHSFVEQKIKPNLREWFEKAIFPREIVPEMGFMSLLGVHLFGNGRAVTRILALTDSPKTDSANASRADATS
jgi:hypothetical protein